MAGLWILILGGFMQVFVGGEVTETAMAVGGALLFSGKYLLYEYVPNKMHRRLLVF